MKVQLIRNIALVFLSIPLQVLLMFVLPSGIAVWIGQKSRLVETNWVSVTTLAILCQVVGTLVHRPFLRRVTDPQIVYVLKRRVAIPNLKQKVVLSLLVLFVLGSLGELGRGLWFFWAGSFAFWTLTLANTWKVWKHVFAPPSAAVGEEAITPAYDVLKDFKFFLYSIIIGRVYAIGLIVLLALTTSKRF